MRLRLPGSRTHLLLWFQRTFFATALLALLACGQDSPTSPAGIPQRLPTGNWGGDHIGLIVTGAGAKIEFDCAAGTIDEPVALDRLGRFEKMGTYTRGHGGPIRVDEPPDIHPARYTGSSDGKLLIVTIHLTDTQLQIGTFTAVLGRSPFVVKCL